jgi:uncharacterized surface protein with fasciclin (FAS1) repeats
MKVQTQKWNKLTPLLYKNKYKKKKGKTSKKHEKKKIAGEAQVLEHSH